MIKWKEYSIKFKIWTIVSLIITFLTAIFYALPLNYTLKYWESNPYAFVVGAGVFTFGIVINIILWSIFALKYEKDSVSKN